jgi:hypothetical protein
MASEKDTTRLLVEALQTSGFALVKSHLLPASLQERALKASGVLFGANDQDIRTLRLELELVVEHPADPKVYLESNIRL